MQSLSASGSTHRSTHVHINTQASGYACHMLCVVFYAHDQGSFSFLALAPLCLASLPAPPRGPGLVWGRQRKAELWAAGGAVETLP